jgi:hypothetical protein
MADALDLATKPKLLDVNMKNSFFKIALASILGCSAAVQADNPIVNYHYLADPTALVINDEFWIIADLDDESVTGYNIKAYYALSSKDMVNWTDHGEVFRVPRDVSWAGSAWAPAAVWRNNKIYIYYPNSTSGIGVATASSPAGPYIDPVGHAIVDHNASRGNLCDNVVWCFDPGVFVDTDGQGYLIWGGGGGSTDPNMANYGNNFRMIKLKSDMITVDGAMIKVTGTDSSFEAPYITKRNSTYYLSYNAQGQTIKYATSNSPTGPWAYKGTVLKNPNINGTNINAYNNNHHGFAEFKGKWYAAYHDRRVAIANNDSKPDLHRSVSIDVLEYNADGTFKNMVFTNAGPAKIGNFNPYDSIPATTSSLQQSVRSRTVLVPNAPPYSMLMPKPSGTSWLRLSNVDFGTGAAKFQVNASSLNANNKVEIRSGSPTGTLAGTCSIPSTGSWTGFTTTECTLTGLSGVVSAVYLKFTGADSTAGLKWWKFVASNPPVSSSSVALSSSSAIPQGAYSSATIPGTVQAENYDVGGEGVAYHDADAVNSGNIYRTDGVDIAGDATSGYKLGWTTAAEWLEYTVDVANAGAYDWEANVSSGGDGASFRILLDNLPFIDTVKIPNTGSWDTYSIVKGTTPNLTAGRHVLQLVIDGAYGNLDWLAFKISVPVATITGNGFYDAGQHTVYSLSGSKVGVVELGNPANMKEQVSRIVSLPGVYVVKSATGALTQKVYVSHPQSLR